MEAGNEAGRIFDPLKSEATENARSELIATTQWLQECGPSDVHVLCIPAYYINDGISPSLHLKAPRVDVCSLSDDPSKCLLLLIALPWWPAFTFSRGLDRVGATLSPTLAMTSDKGLEERNHQGLT